MLPDYVIVNGIEAINTARAQAVGADTGDCGADEVCWDCDEAAAEWLNGGDPYGTVMDAPWWDPAVPESAGVLGYTGLEVTGLREAGNGAREFTIRFAAFVRDECAIEYAHAWISNVFRASPCADSCRGIELCMLSCCPDVDEDGELLGPYPLRHIYDAEVVSGPVEISRSWDAPLWIEYEVKLSTPNRWVWRAPAPARRWRVRPSDGHATTVDLIAAYQACPDDEPCVLSCDNPGFAGLPSEPLPRCYPANPFNARRSLISVPSEVVPSGVDVIPVIRAEAGTRAMRNLVVRFYNNPLDIPCDRLPDLNPCRACTDLTVAEIPAGGSLVMDGRTGLNTLTCATGGGRPVERPASVYGPPIEGVGAGYVSPITCGTGLCVEIYAADGVAANAAVTLELWTRGDGA